MTFTSERPAPAGIRGANGKTYGTRHHTARTDPDNASGARTDLTDREFLDELAVELVERTVEVEKRLVSAGFCDAGRLADAAVAEGLDREDFADRLLGVLFSALVCFGQSGDVGYFSAIPAFCRQQSIPIPAGGWDAFLREHIDGLELDGSNIERLAKLIKRAARRRRRTARLWRGLAERMTRDRDRLAASAPVSAMRLDEPAPKAVRRTPQWSAQAVRAAAEIMGGVT